MAWWRNPSRYDFYEPRPRLWDGSAEVKLALTALGKEGVTPRPIRVKGTRIAHTFWGAAWCKNLESYSDYANRLPRGRTYLRGGHVLHLGVEPGSVSAVVRGSAVYRIEIRIDELAKDRWKEITSACAGRIDSLVDLLEGRLSGPVMEIVTRQATGLFPSPREMKMTCSCPDWAGLCKHLAAALYGIGARLDEEPALLFTLRRVDAGELVAKVAAQSVAAFGGTGAGAVTGASRLELAGEDLEVLFGIDLGEARPVVAEARPAVEPPVPAKGAPRKARPRSAEPRIPGPVKASPRTVAAPVRKVVRAEITSAELRDLGVASGTIQNWLMEGVLSKTDKRGIYAKSPETDERIRLYGERKAQRGLTK